MQLLNPSSNRKIMTASAEVSASAPNITYQGRLAFWFHYFLRREKAIEKESIGLIKPYRPKVITQNKATLLLTVNH
jgi:hypothetical protein